MGREQYGVKDKMIPKRTIVTIPFSSFPVSATVYINCGYLIAYAKRRMFSIVNNLDQSLSTCAIRPVSGSCVTEIVNGYSPTQTFNVSAGGAVSVADAGFAGDTCYLVATVGATAPASGSLIVYVQEVV
jgi:hypothetical protein